MYIHKLFLGLVGWEGRVGGGPFCFFWATDCLLQYFELGVSVLGQGFRVQMGESNLRLKAVDVHVPTEES